MTEIGEGVSVGSGSGSNIDDLDEFHWLEVEYVYQNGAPIYGTFKVTDSDGMLWLNTLNDQGQACLAGLPPGDAQVEFLPEEHAETELSETRREIQAILDRIVEDQKEQAALHEAELAQQSGVVRTFTHVHRFGSGLWKGGVGLVEFVATSVSKAAEVAHYLLPLNQMQNVLSAGYKSYQEGELTWDEWRNSLTNNLQQEHQEDIARLLGVEPEDISRKGLQEAMGKVTEAYDMAAFISDDPDSREMLVQFARDMADAQSSLDWAEFAGAGVFEIVLAALLAVFTGGAGNAAQAASKVRHAAHLRGLGHQFQKLARLLKHKKMNKKVKVSVDQKTTIKTDQPDIIEIKAREPYPYSDEQRALAGPSSPVVTSRPLREQMESLSSAEQHLVRNFNAGFSPQGVSKSEALDFILNTKTGQDQLKMAKLGDPSADQATILNRVLEQVQSGTSVPVRRDMNAPLVKIVSESRTNAGRGPFFTTAEQLEIARTSERPLSDVFGLPGGSDAEKFRVFQIEPKGTATVFESTIAPTSELGGKLRTQGGLQQFLVPNRNQFEDAVEIDVISDNL